MQLQSKLCKGCNKVKFLKEFYKSSRTRDKFCSRCTQCYKDGARKKYDEGYTRFGQGAICILRRCARAKKIPFDLTADFLKPWWLNQPEVCFYCSIDMNKYIEIREFILTYKGINSMVNKFKGFYRSKHLRKTRWMTIDRYDNIKGYTPDNIVKACWICNGFKSNIFNGDQMKIIGPMLISNLISEIETAMEII